MLPRNLIVLSMLLLGTPCFGAPPVASLRSSDALTINGIAVPAHRVSWPVSVNDVIATENGAARLRFTDGSTVTLQRNSRARIESASSRVEVKMLSGSAIYDVKKASAVSVTAPHLREAAAATRIVVPREITATSSATAASYRMAAAQSASDSRTGMLVAPQAVSTGSFAGRRCFHQHA